MSKLQKGRLYISKEDIIEKLGLTGDTIINPAVNTNGDIEIDVIASGENKHDWLVDSTNSHWNMQRHRLDISHVESVIDVLSHVWNSYHMANNLNQKIEEIEETINNLDNEQNEVEEYEDATSELLDMMETYIDKKIEDAIKASNKIDLNKLAKSIQDGLKLSNSVR